MGRLESGQLEAAPTSSALESSRGSLAAATLEKFDSDIQSPEGAARWRRRREIIVRLELASGALPAARNGPENGRAERCGRLATGRQTRSSSPFVYLARETKATN